MIKKGLAVAVIILFIGMCVVPLTAVQELKEVSTVSFDRNKLYVDDDFNKLNTTESFEGYTLFAPWFSTKSYLINNKKRVVHTWQSQYMPGLPVYLLENGNLLRGCYKAKPGLIWGAGDTGRIEMFSWENELLWSFEYVNETICLHHDIEPLPNGNILMISWETRSADEMIESGCDPNLITEESYWIDHIIEVKPNGPENGDIVWEWHVWDHLIQDYDPTKKNYGIVADHPELIDINVMAQKSTRDLTHTNSIDFHPELNQILLSIAALDEIWILDHSTTTGEASGHSGGNSGKGGDILYRWGNPQVYKTGSGADQKLFGQHDAQWIEKGCPGEGHITIFNNGWGRPVVDYSSIVEIETPVTENGSYMKIPGSAYEPENPLWIYSAKNPTNFYSPGQSSAQRLPNGNTLICHAGFGLLFEVTEGKNVVWMYLNLKVNPFMGGGPTLFHAHRYPLNYSGIHESVIFVEKESEVLQKSTQALEVTMPVNQHSYSFPLLQRLLERFPNMFPKLHNLLEL
jgi:hypothetical protein